MSSIRSSRTRRVRRARLATAAAGVALAAFSLTACDDGSGVKDEGASAGSAGTASPASDSSVPGSSVSGSPVADAKPAPDGSRPATSVPAASAPGTSTVKPGGAAPSASEPAGPARRAVCDGSTTRTTAAPVNRPVNHMLLTVTNTGTTACDLYYYPAVRFSGAQSVPPVIEESQPQAVVSLAPGESGYAGVALASADGSGAHGYTAKSLSVHFANSKGHSGYDGRAAHPALPAKGVYLDDSIKVTYWQTSMDAALTW